MAGLTPAECYAAMQGTDGIAMGYTTFADHPDPDTAETHASCLALEAAAGCTRYWEGVRTEPGATADTAQAFVMWMPVPDFTAFPPPPANAPLRSADEPIPAADAPPADEPPAE